MHIVEGYSASLTQQVQAGELDFAIVPAFLGAMGLRSRLFLRTPEVLVSSLNSPLAHAKPIRLSTLGPLDLVVPGKVNTRRNLIEAYLSSNGVRINRQLELDAMLGTLDFVSQSDWRCILPGIMMAEPLKNRSFTVNPIVDPPFGLDLIQIEPSSVRFCPPLRPPFSKYSSSRRLPASTGAGHRPEPATVATAIQVADATHWQPQVTFVHAERIIRYESGTNQKWPESALSWRCCSVGRHSCSNKLLLKFPSGQPRAGDVCSTSQMFCHQLPNISLMPAGWVLVIAIGAKLRQPAAN